jgi:hypothetical protein
VAGKGFCLNLPNGITVSVQWGPGNYTDSDVRNKECIAPREAAANDENWSANTAECAAYMTDSPMGWVAVPGYTHPGVDVVGWLNVEQMLDFINVAAQLTGFPAKENPDSIGNKIANRWAHSATKEESDDA